MADCCLKKIGQMCVLLRRWTLVSYIAQSSGYSWRRPLLPVHRPSPWPVHHRPEDEALALPQCLPRVEGRTEAGGGGGRGDARAGLI